ncbi:MoaD/ThiS family protein [Arthrobacter pigmenti]
MMVRYFGAARAAAGMDQENLDVPDGTALNDVLDTLVQLHPEPGDGRPSLKSVVGRSSFLRNEVALKDRTAPLAASDVIDVLPPFAGG